MNAFQATCAATALLLFVGTAHAQDVTAIPAGQDQIVPVKKGEPAPFEGQLFDNNSALRWGNWLLQYKALVKNNKELDQKICQADVDLGQKKYDLAQQEYTRVTAELQDKLKKAEDALANPPWYRTQGFGAAVGILATVLVIGGTAAIIHEVR